MLHANTTSLIQGWGDVTLENTPQIPRDGCTYGCTYQAYYVTGSPNEEIPRLVQGTKVRGRGGRAGGGLAPALAVLRHSETSLLRGDLSLCIEQKGLEQTAV